MMGTEVTAGPWRLQRTQHNGINGAWIVGGDNIVCRITPKADKSLSQKETDAELILSAINACFSINPQDPLAVAREIGEAFRIVRVLIESQVTKELLDAARDGRALLSRIEGKVK